MGSSGCTTKSQKTNKYQQATTSEEMIFKYALGAIALSVVAIGTMYFLKKQQ